MWTLIDADQPDVEADLAAPPRRRRSLWRVFGYSIASLALAAGLLAQISYRHLDRITGHETLRPWLMSACEVANCVLPDRVDSNLLVSDQLSIGPHPEYQDISQMTLTFTNTAGFAQPLPAIELVFSDIEGQPVAGRRFLPHQYASQPPLAAANPVAPAQQSQTAQQALAAQQSMTAQLAFATPDEAAVNYRVRFLYE